MDIKRIALEIDMLKSQSRRGVDQMEITLGDIEWIIEHTTSATQWIQRKKKLEAIIYEMKSLVREIQSD